MTKSHSKIQLRPYQKECLEKIPESGSYLIQMATGLGKTVTFSQIPRRGRMLILSHRQELVDQPVKYFDVPVGIEQGNRVSHGEEVVSASVQSIKNRLNNFKPNDFDIIITDEAHHAVAKTYQDIYKYFKPRLHLGFTATPNRHDKIGLFPIFKKVIYQYPLKKGVVEGYLSDIECIRAKVAVDFTQIRSRAGEFVTEDLEKVMLQENNVKSIVEAYENYAKGQTLIFAVSVNHAERIAGKIPGAKIILGQTPQEERRQIIEDFKNNKFNCLVNCMVLTEGADIPNIETIILARPTQSEVLYQQMVGRGTRKYPGKEKLRLVDIVGVTACHKLCTFPDLLGIDTSLIPLKFQDELEGSLFEIEKKAAQKADVFDNWIKSAELVDIWAEEEDLDTHNINFVRLPDGSLKVRLTQKDIVIPPPDALGKVYNAPLQSVIDRLFYHLLNFHSKEDNLWDLGKIDFWKNEAITPKQINLINRLSRGKYKDRIEDLNKFEAQQLITRLSW